MTIAQRFQLFIERLRVAPAEATAAAAFALIRETLNQVEDAYSGVGVHPNQWRLGRRLAAMKARPPNRTLTTAIGPGASIDRVFSV